MVDHDFLCNRKLRFLLHKKPPGDAHSREMKNVAKATRAQRVESRKRDSLFYSAKWSDLSFLR